MDDVLTADAGLDLGGDTGFDGGDQVAGDQGNTSVDSSTDGGLDVQDPDQPVAGDQGKDFKAIENGRLTPKLKAHIEALRTTDPAAAKAIQRALFLEESLRGKFGGDLGQLDSMREAYEQLGGEDGIREVHQELDGWRQFDEQFTAGDPKVLDFITSTPEAKDAFLKMAPMVIDRYRETHPDGYDAYIASAFDATIQGFKIPLLMERLGDFLNVEGANPKALELYGQLQKFFGFIDQKSRAQVTAPKFTQAQQPDNERQKFEQERESFTRKQWFGDVSAHRQSVFMQSLVKQIGEKAATEKADSIQKYFLVNLTDQINKKYGPGKVSQQLEKYFKAGQQSGYTKYGKSVYDEVVPLAVRITLGEMGLKQSGVGAKPAQAAKPGAPAAKVPTGKPGEGYRFVGGKPDMSTVDNMRTTPVMFSAGKAVLKNGQRVQWRKQ